GTYTYGDGKPVTCCECESPLNGGFCLICASRAGNSSACDPNLNSYNDSPNFSDYPPQPQYQTYMCELCGNDAHFGYDCPPQVLFVYNQNPCFDQNFDNNFPLTSPKFSQQNLVCENYGGPHATFQPMNQNFNYSNSFGFDQYQPPQFFVTHQLPQKSNKDMLLEMAKLIKNNRILFNSNIFPYEEMSMRFLMAKERILKLIQDWDENQIKSWSLPELLLQLLNDSQTINESLKQREEKRIENEQTANLAVQKEQEEQAAQSFTLNWNLPMINDDEEYSIQFKEYLENSSKAITPDLPTEEPEYSLSMGEEHLSTIPETESDEVIKSSVENLVPIPNDESFSHENVPKENFKIYSNSLFDEEIISTKIDLHYFNAESYLIKSLLNRDTLIDSSPKFDYFFEEFSGELAYIDPIPPGIKEADFDLKEEICLFENLSYDNSSPQPQEELNAEIADTILESLSPSPIPVEDSDSHMEEIDLFLATDDSMPPGIENDDYDSEGDIRFLEELLSNDSPSLPENESSNLDHFNDPSSPCPPLEPPDAEICFDFEPDTGVLTTKMVKGISEHYVLMPNILPTLPILDPDSDFTPSHDSLRSGNKIFDPGIFIEVQSERLLSRDEFSISFIRDPLYPVFDTLLPFSFAGGMNEMLWRWMNDVGMVMEECQMEDRCVMDIWRFENEWDVMRNAGVWLTRIEIDGWSVRCSDVVCDYGLDRCHRKGDVSGSSSSIMTKDCPDFEGSRARCFVHRSLALQILSMLILGIRYP
ncbi:hypothetical protein Tco_1278195, partial [Tanacetum coccineum]